MVTIATPGKLSVTHHFHCNLDLSLWWKMVVVAFLCDWLCVFTSKQTNGWNRRILQEPCNHNALDLLFGVFWCGRVTGASPTLITRWHHFTHSAFQRNNNNADSGFLASVKTRIWPGVHFTDDLETRETDDDDDDDDAVHSWKRAGWMRERAVVTACVRARAHVSHRLWQSWIASFRTFLRQGLFPYRKHQEGFWNVISRMNEAEVTRSGKYAFCLCWCWEETSSWSLVVAPNQCAIWQPRCNTVSN